MIEIKTGTLDEKIIRLLLNKYPITVKELIINLNISREVGLRVLKKYQTKGILQLESLPNKTFIRLIRNDFSFIGKKNQRKFIKHKSGKKPKKKDYDGIMYS